MPLIDMVVAKTRRLILSKVSLEDAPLFLKIMNSPEWLDYVGDRNINSIEDAENHLKEKVLISYDENGFGAYKVILKEPKDISIGVVTLFKRKEMEHVDIGFAFLQEYYAKGYGYESASEVMKLGKEQYKIKRLTGITSPRNIASQKLLEKLGMKLEKRVNPWDEPEELLLYAKNL
jgi:RimJ/RimL family protein N-acetyltransferase